MAGVGGRPALNAVRDDGFDARIGCCLRDHRFGTGGEAKKADAMNPAPGKVGDGSAHVAVPLPAKGVLVTGALAAPTRVVQEHLVARFRQHACVADRSLTVAATAVHEHDRGTVAGAYVPAGEVNPVARRERNAFVW